MSLRCTPLVARHFFSLSFLFFFMSFCRKNRSLFFSAQHEVNGFCVPCGDKDGYVTGLRNLVKDKNKRNKVLVLQYGTNYTIELNCFILSYKQTTVHSLTQFSKIIYLDYSTHPPLPCLKKHPISSKPSLHCYTVGVSLCGVGAVGGGQGRNASVHISRT